MDIKVLVSRILYGSSRHWNGALSRDGNDGLTAVGGRGFDSHPPSYKAAPTYETIHI